MLAVFVVAGAKGVALVFTILFVHVGAGLFACAGTPNSGRSTCSYVCGGLVLWKRFQLSGWVSCIMALPSSCLLLAFVLLLCSCKAVSQLVGCHGSPFIRFAFRINVFLTGNVEHRRNVDISFG